ncbi:ketopantoate reductase family protein, partial [Xanthomonas citri pv. citri]|nr:ketopantoate reductase family protein [Xanthomonas citri pv. citri]
DAEAGRPMEIDAIGGALLRAGERHGIDTPVIRDLMTRLQAQQSS